MSEFKCKHCHLLPENGMNPILLANLDYQTFYNLVVQSRLFDGVGYYPYDEFVHVDVRDNGKNPNLYMW